MSTTAIYHRADYDGIFCLEIARKFLPPDTKFIGWDFGDPLIPFPAEGEVYVMDLSPDCIADLPEHTSHLDRLIWIDHHKSAIDKFSPAIKGYRIDGVAASRLAWQWFLQQWRKSTGMVWLLPDITQFKERKVTEPEAVMLAGEYDIWDHAKSNSDDVAFQFGLDTADELQWHLLLGEDGAGTDYVMRLIEDGKKAMRCYAKRDADVVQSRSFIARFDGLTFLCLNTARCNSNTFNVKDKPETGHDALLAFYWTGKDWSVSMYHAAHRKDLDLSKIAVERGKEIDRRTGKPFGGGGHRGACGFRSSNLPFIP